MGVFFNKQKKKWEFQYVNKDELTKKEFPRPHGYCKNADGSDCKNKQEAVKAFEQFKIDLHNGKYSKNKDSSQIYLTDLVEMYEDYGCDQNSGSYTNTIKYCKYFLEFIKTFYRKDIPINDIKKIDAIRYRKMRQTSRIKIYMGNGNYKETDRFPKNSTINREINSIQGMFTWAVNTDDMLKTNPLSKLPKLEIEDVSIEPYDEEKMDLIYKMAKGSYMYSMIIIFDDTGMRRSELLNLKFEHVHFDYHFYSFGYLEVLNPKNRQKRTIPMSEDVRNEILALKDYYKEINLDAEYVFTNPKTGTRYKNVNKKFNNILKKLKLKQRGRAFHILRHGFATQLEIAGTPTVDIQDLLGHKHRSSTETYLHRDKKRKQICINIKCEKRKEYKNLQESSKTAPKMPIGIKNTKIAV